MASPTTQAQLEATVRFGPQRFALREMLAQALLDRNLAIRSAVGASRGIQSAISTARRETQQGYAQAGQTVDTNRSIVDQVLSKIGGAADPYKAIVASDRGQSDTRSALDLAGTLKDLSNRRVAAASGAAFAGQKAQSDFGATVGKVNRSYLELANEKGAFTAGRSAELRKEAAQFAFQKDLAQEKLSVEKRGQDLSHQDRQSAIDQRKQAAADKKKAAALGKPITPAEQRARAKLLADAKTKIGAAQTWITRFRSGSKPLNDQEIRDKLSTGDTLKVSKSVPIIDPKTGKAQTDARGQVKTRSVTTEIKVPAIDPDFVQAALDLAGQGYLSTESIHALRARKVHVIQEWLAPKPPKPATQTGPTRHNAGKSPAHTG